MSDENDKVSKEDVENAKQLTKELEQLAVHSENFKNALKEVEVSSSSISVLHSAIKKDLEETETLNAKEIAAQEKIIQKLKERIDLDIAQGKISAEEGENKKKNLETTEKQIGILKETEEVAKNELNTVIKKDQSLINIRKKFQDIQSIGKLRLDNEELIAARMQFSNMVTSAMLETVSKYAGKILDLALEVDNASRELMKTATFTYEEAKSGLINVTAAAAGSGLSMADAAKSLATLKTDFSGFTTLTGEGRTQVTAMVGVLDKMGLSAQTSAKFLDTTVKSLGMSNQQSLAYLSSLKGFADQSGIAMKQISDDLAANTANITKFGQDGTKVFKEMSLASKQLGISMSELFSITEKFTTFSGAAEAAGQLNAVLGGDFLNSVDLLTASMESPTEVFKQFKESMDASGKSFDDLDNGMKRVVASSMGMTVEQAGRAMAMDINTATAAMKEQEQTQETLNEMSGKMVSLTEKLQTALAALYPAIEPIVDILASFADTFTTFAVKLANFVKENPIVLAVFKGLAVTIGSLGFALGVLGTTILPIYAQIKTMQLLFGGLGPAIRIVTSNFSSFGGAILRAVMASYQFVASFVTKVIPSLFSGAASALSFGASMTVNVIGSLISGVSRALTFAVALGTTVASSFMTAAGAAISFSVTMASTVINAFINGARRAIAFGITMLTSLVPGFTGVASTGFLAGLASIAAGSGAATGGTAASVGAIGFLAFGAAVLMAGVGIGIAAWGISKIIDAFTNLISLADGTTTTLILISFAMLTTAYSVTILSVAMVAMVVAIGALALSGVGAAAVGMILSIAAAFLAMGSAIALASIGLSVFINSVGSMFVSATKLVDSLSSVNTETVSSFVKLVDVFSDLAESINEIDVGILEKLSSFSSPSVLTMTTRQISSTLASVLPQDLSFGNERQPGETAMSTSSEPIVIKVELNVDSPIYLDDKKVGKHVAKISKDVFHDKLKQARTSLT